MAEGNPIGFARFGWQPTPTPRRAMLLVAAVLLAAALVLAAAAANAVPRKIVRTVRAQTPAALTVDAVGCPVASHCRVTPSATPGLATAMADRFPTATVISSNTTTGQEDGRVYRSSIVADLGQAGVLVAAAQCDPRAAVEVFHQDRNNVTHIDLAGNEVVDLSTITTVVPGKNGCTVSVQLRSASAAPPELPLAVQLAGDPKAQLGS